MMKQYHWQNLPSEQREQLLLRPQQREDIQQHVAKIIATVQASGDAALQEYTQKFDGIAVDNWQLSAQQLSTAREKISLQVQQAIELAYQNIDTFHQAQQLQTLVVETVAGVTCERHWRPIQNVGLYVPGGTAPLISTVMMLAIPAKIAGCTQRTLVTPPQADGNAHPALCYAAQLCGIDTIYTVGGAQAIAALAYGTETIAKVDKIFGPGNAWVTAAKQQVAHDPLGATCDMPAGPSEVLIIADQQADPHFVAADLLSQAEHGVDSQVILLSDSAALIQGTQTAIAQQIAQLPRQVIAQQALQQSAAILVQDIAQALAISNRYAPEHLIINTVDAEQWIGAVQCAGSVFVGPWSAETLGDYITGSNHVLPTYGYARSVSGLSLQDFMCSFSVQKVTPAGLSAIAPAAACLARVEGLQAHAYAAEVRLQTLAKAPVVEIC